MTSKGAAMTSPPAATRLPAASSALRTHTYVFHTALDRPASGCEPTAATSAPGTRAMKYRPGASGGIESSNSHPNRRA